MTHANMQTLLSGIGIGGVTGITLLASEVVITGATQVPVEHAATVAVGLCSIVWWMGKNFQKLADGQKRLNEKVEAIEIHCSIVSSACNKSKAKSNDNE